MAMLALVILITLIGTYVISDALTRITAQVKIERDSRSLDAMQEAKAALIAWSASQAWTGNTTDQPGSLPCPDTTNDGSSDISGGACLSQVGRLPWKTLNARELRDASGEILWYALSPNLRNASGVTVINSDTQGQLVLYSDKDSTTTATLSNVVAFVIAPGVAVAGQTRNSSGVNTAANYLEGRNSGATGNYTNTPQSPASYPDTFNDQILPLTHSDLFSVVEQAVASRIESDIKQYIAPVSGSSITSYFSQWGGFPFPAIFSNATYTNGPGTSAQRAQTAYIGSTTTSTSGGLLPLTTTDTYTWTTGSATVTLTGGTAASISGTTCSLVTGGMQCDFNINPRLTGCCSYSMVNPQFRVSAPIANVGLGFVDLPDDVSSGLSPRVTVTNLTGTTRTMSGTSIFERHRRRYRDLPGNSCPEQHLLCRAGDAGDDSRCNHEFTHQQQRPLRRLVHTKRMVPAGLLRSITRLAAGWRRQLQRAARNALVPHGQHPALEFRVNNRQAGHPDTDRPLAQWLQPALRNACELPGGPEHHADRFHLRTPGRDGFVHQ